MASALHHGSVGARLKPGTVPGVAAHRRAVVETREAWPRLSRP